MAFETPNVEPSTAPDKWAPETAKPGTGANVKSETLEEIESQAWLSDEPAAPAAKTPDPEETVEEPESTPEEVAEPEETEEQPEVEVAAPTPRAQQRIQQLANEKRELQQQMALLLERQTKADERQARADEQRQQQEYQYLQQQQQQAQYNREAQAKHDYDQMLLANGQDPNAPHNQAAFEAIRQAGLLSRQLEELKQQNHQQRTSQAVDRYVNAMNEHAKSVLDAYEVSPKQLAAVQRSAYAIAQAQQLANPHDAVKLALEAYENAQGEIGLPKKGTTATAPAPKSKSQPVDAMIAQRGSRGDAQKGQLSNGRKPKQSLEQLETEMGAGGWR